MHFSDEDTAFDFYLEEFSYAAVENKAVYDSFWEWVEDAGVTWDD